MKTGLVFRRIGTEKWADWEPEHVVWLLRQLNAPLADGGLGPDLKEPEAFPCYPHAPGSVETPWKMKTIEQWRGAAAQQVGTGFNTGMYEVGGVLLERNPSEGDFNNYITAVVDPIRHPLAVAREVSPRGNLLIFDGPQDRSNRTIYEIKCDRLRADGRDQEVAALARRVMKGKAKVSRDLIELPNSLGAMFISEVARLPLMLPLGIMMLDLMEANVHYGRTTPKRYTWRKLMSYTKDEDGEERLTQAKLYGGKHPMMHEKSINQAKAFSECYNMVTLRSISILVEWLHTYLKRRPCGWETRVKRADRTSFDVKRPASIKAQALKQFDQLLRSRATRKPHGEFYSTAIMPALRARSQSLDLLF